MHVPPVIHHLNPLQDPNTWDDLVSAHPDATFFHTSSWAGVLQQSYGFTPIYLLATNPPSTIHHPPSTINHPPSSILPLLEVSSPLTGRRGVSLPFTDACPPLVRDEAPFDSLFNELNKLGKARGWKYWECRGLKTLPPGTPSSIAFHGHTLDLSAGEDALLKGVKSNVRTALRKSEQAGVQVEISSTLEALQTFYALHCRTRRSHGLPPQPFRFFRAIHDHILANGSSKVVVASAGQKPIAANVYFHWRKHVIYKFGASDDRFQELRGSNLVMWRAIQHYAREGYQTLDFGRTSANAEGEGLRRYKLGWGTREHRIDYVRFDCRENRFVNSADEAYGWHNALMGRMPLPMLRLLGAALYPHIG